MIFHHQEGHHRSIYFRNTCNFIPLDKIDSDKADHFLRFRNATFVLKILLIINVTLSIPIKSET